MIPDGNMEMQEEMKNNRKRYVGKYKLILATTKTKISYIF